MWMCDPEILCRSHLLGEHKEIHQLLGSIRKGIRLGRLVDRNCVEPHSLWARHEVLAGELLRRGYRHESPLPSEAKVAALVDANLSPEEAEARVRKPESLDDLLGRCVACRERARVVGPRSSDE